MTRQSITHLLAVAALAFVACNCSPADHGEAHIIDDNGPTLAIVIFIDLEGGFYGIITDNGEHHEPVNLHMDYQVDSLRISYKYDTLQNVGSYRMWGTPIKILEIQVLSK